MTKTTSSVQSNAALVEWRIFKHRFAVLLGAMILFLIAPPLLHTTGFIVNPIAVRVVIVVLFSASLIAAVFALSRGRLAQIIAILLATPAIILHGMNTLLDREGFMVPSHLFAILFLGYALLQTMSYLLTADRLNPNSICAALCTYLLVGTLWAIVYSLLDIMNPGSFSFALAGQGESAAMRFGGEHSLHSLYYSFATMTTLGSWEITPVSPATRISSVIEAVMGQLVLLLLVAQLVGLHVIRSSQNSE